MSRSVASADFGELLKQYRKKVGMTLRGVARRGGMTDAYISQMESGYVSQPSPHKLYALARIYTEPGKLQETYCDLMQAVGYVVPWRPAVRAKGAR